MKPRYTVPWILNLESGGGMFAAESATGARSCNWGGSRPVIPHIQRNLGGMSRDYLRCVTIYANNYRYFTTRNFCEFHIVIKI